MRSMMRAVSRGTAKEVARRLCREYPDATCALRHRNAFELLVATILSAQCTDERVNQVTPRLFEKYPTPEKMARAPRATLERMIRPTGFFRNKARAILGMSRMLVEEFGGKVPDRLEDLVRLPGVARKTANVVLGTWYGIASGVVVDTHVFRLSHRLGLSRQKDPNKVERDLMEALDREYWVHFGHAMIWHGRRVCHARKPACDRCVLADLCPSAFHVERGGRAR
jgi:endonuclease-3